MITHLREKTNIRRTYDFFYKLSSLEKLQYLDLKEDELKLRIKHFESDNALKVFQIKRNTPFQDLKKYSVENHKNFMKILNKDLEKLYESKEQLVKSVQ